MPSPANPAAHAHAIVLLVCEVYQETLYGFSRSRQPIMGSYKVTKETVLVSFIFKSIATAVH